MIPVTAYFHSLAGLFVNRTIKNDGFSPLPAKCVPHLV